MSIRSSRHTCAFPDLFFGFDLRREGVGACGLALVQAGEPVGVPGAARVIERPASLVLLAVVPRGFPGDSSILGFVPDTDGFSSLT